jgi:hypothetical protein
MIENQLLQGIAEERARDMLKKTILLISLQQASRHLMWRKG